MIRTEEPVKSGPLRILSWRVIDSRARYRHLQLYGKEKGHKLRHQYSPIRVTGKQILQEILQESRGATHQGRAAVVIHPSLATGTRLVLEKLRTGGSVPVHSGHGTGWRDRTGADAVLTDGVAAAAIRVQIDDGK
jgi:hypothetical protein